MKNVQKETRNQEMRLKDFGCKALDAIEMLVVLATAALLLIGSAVTAKAEPVSGQHENSILPRVEFNIAVPEGNVDNETLDLADRILNTLPDKLLNEFIESDWKLYVTSNMPVLTFFSGIYGEPNGRPDLEAHYIEVTSDQETMGKTLLHEFGHYVDYTKGDVSLKSEFENIYENSSEAFASQNFLLMASQNIIAGTAIRWKKNILNFAGILKLQSVRIMYQENLYNI